MAEALRRTGRVADGLTAIDGALARAENTGERCSISEVLRIKGELLLLHGARGATAAAEDHSGKPSTGRAGRAPFPANCAPPPASPGCGAVRAVPRRGWRSSGRSTTASRKDSARPTSRRPRRFLTPCNSTGCRSGWKAASSGQIGVANTSRRLRGSCWPRRWLAQRGRSFGESCAGLARLCAASHGFRVRGRHPLVV